MLESWNKVFLVFLLDSKCFQNVEINFLLITYVNQLFQPQNCLTSCFLYSLYLCVHVCYREKVNLIADFFSSISLSLLLSSNKVHSKTIQH